MSRFLSATARRAAIRLAAKGRTYREIVDETGVSQGSVSLIVAALGGVIRPEDWQVSASRLSLDDRVEIKLSLENNDSFAAIGRKLGRVTSTISREVGGVAKRREYRPMAAHRAACLASKRPKATKLAANPVLCARVIADLEKFWSPEEISGRLQQDYPDDLEMRVSHETIYKSIYIQGRGELRHELAQCLRTGRTKRQSNGRLEKRSQISSMVSISDRPAEVADRAVPGHWEGDLIIGAAHLSAVGTLVERTSRFTMLVHLPDGYKAKAVSAATATRIKELPDVLRRSLTWDQGREMAHHAAFTIDTGVQVFFCHPHSPWERPTNENTNGLLRQYMPKGTDLNRYSKQDLDAIEKSLNERPRKVLGYMTPSEKFAELIATTD